MLDLTPVLHAGGLAQGLLAESDSDGNDVASLLPLPALPDRQPARLSPGQWDSLLFSEASEDDAGGLFLPACCTPRSLHHHFILPCVL